MAKLSTRIRPVSSRPYAPKDTPEVRAAIIQFLTEGFTFKDSANKAGVPYSTLRQWRQDDPVLNQQCEEAYDEGTDILEREAQRRAVDGVDKPVFQGGIQVGSVREYSDTLMNIMLQGRRPAKYRKSLEVTGPGGGPLVTKLEVEFVSSPEKKPGAKQ